MRKADNPPPSCVVVTKSGKLNFLEPSGPVQACNGTALPFKKHNNLLSLNACDKLFSSVVYKFRLILCSQILA